MGLFDFLKKSRSDPPSTSVVSDKTGERTSVFKGDLAFIQDSDTVTKKEPAKVDNPPSQYTGENKDSVDSFVYMSFATAIKKIWICPECGTHNEESLNGCVVCGLKK